MLSFLNVLSNCLIFYTELCTITVNENSYNFISVWFFNVLESMLCTWHSKNLQVFLFLFILWRDLNNIENTCSLSLWQKSPMKPSRFGVLFVEEVVLWQFSLFLSCKLSGLDSFSGLLDQLWEYMCFSGKMACHLSFIFAQIWAAYSFMILISSLSVVILPLLKMSCIST